MNDTASISATRRCAGRRHRQPRRRRLNAFLRRTPYTRSGFIHPIEAAR
jgi:hypothetical protein